MSSAAVEHYNKRCEVIDGIVKLRHHVLVMYHALLFEKSMIYVHAHALERKLNYNGPRELILWQCQ